MSEAMFGASSGVPPGVGHGVIPCLLEVST
jgi:hypothetical protein